MLNYFILLFTLFTFNNVILLNEETLILVCFIIFSWLFNKNVGTLLKKDFNRRSNEIKSTIQFSLKEILSSLDKSLNTKYKFWSLFYNFELLAKHYLKFAYIAAGWYDVYKFKKAKIVLPQRLQFIYRLENCTSKLLSLVLVKKLTKIVQLKFFYSLKLKNPYFICLYKINVRECLQSIKLT
uniref:ATP synthase B chain n=1 Tax=Sheathia arcuata TaxID=340433 RepID=A0A1Z1XA73_9FLOR|nr:ATP synthase B chain precursor [Sheathia arcuata]ARX95747.1 ATP synthase B chain precursor [Sheathia arcuata]